MSDLLEIMKISLPTIGEYSLLYIKYMFVYIFLKSLWVGFQERGLNINISFKELLFYPIIIIVVLGYILGEILSFVITPLLERLGR